MKAGFTKRITVPSILARKEELLTNPEARITALTAYDYSMARLLDSAGIDIILIGDSLGSVIQGHETTIPVTLDEVIYHCRCVTRGVARALVVGDMPFMSYQVSPEKALESAGRLIKESGVAAVKLEGGVFMAATIRRLVEVDIPVMGHIGLTPQSYHRMGGHRMQGKKEALNPARSAGSRTQVLEDARAVEEAGAFAVVVEGVPAELAREISQTISIPTIGIGAGPGCDGQVLVLYDMLGLTGGDSPSFVRRYAELGRSIEEAVGRYIAEIRSGSFPERPYS